MNDIQWRDIPGYEGEYMASSDGQIYSVPRIVSMKDGRQKTVRGKILRQHKSGHGYLQVRLRANEHQYVHRLVASAFLEKKSPNLEVNHKDENKMNNCVDNLEWVTRRENLSYGTRNKKSRASGIKHAKCIVAIQNGATKMQFQSLREAERAGFSRHYISQCCRGILKQYDGYVWRFRSISAFSEGG